MPLGLSATAAVVSVQTAVAAFGAFASLAPGVGVVVIGRRVCNAWVASLAGLLLLFSGSVGEAAGWGGFPQLLGLGLLPLLVWSVDKWFVDGGRRAAIGAGLAIAVVAATSDLVVVAAVLAAVVTIALRLTVAKPAAKRGSSWADLVWIVLPSLVVAPFYVPLLSALARRGGSHTIGTRLTPTGFLDGVEFLFRDTPVVGWVGVVVLLVAPALLFDMRRTRLYVATVAIATSSVVLSLALSEVRFLYVLPVAVALGICLWGEAVIEHHDHVVVMLGRVGLVALIAGTALQGWRSFDAFEGQRDYYAVMDASTVQALDWIRRETPPDAVILAPPVNNAPISWWIEGYARRATLGGSPLRWLGYPDEVRRARLANRLLGNFFNPETDLALARAAGVDYVLIPQRSANIDQSRLQAWIAAHPDAVAFSAPTAWVLPTA